MSSADDNIPAKNSILSGSEIMHLPGPEAELVLNALPFDDQLECVLQVPWKERLNIIMQSQASRELVQALPPEEVFWMIKERGVEDSLPIIARTTHEQFQHLIDIDCWNKEELVPENFLAWYRMLARCNITKVHEWFEQEDHALLVAPMKNFVQVHKIEEESDFSEEYEEMPPCTLDGVNFFKFSTEEAQTVLLPLLKVIRSHNPDRFQSLIEGLIWDSRVEAEDEALHWRQSRVAEKGFPLFDEALGVYETLSSDDMQPVAQAGSETSSAQVVQQHGSLRVHYALAEDRLPDFLGDVLPALDNEQIENFEHVLISTANKVMVADCMEVRDLNDVRRALRKTAGYVSIGLEHRSAGDSHIAQSLAAEIHPEVLFRCGYTLVKQIATQVRRHSGAIWIDSTDRFNSFYGTPLADAALGLVRSRPLFYEGLIEPGSSLYRDFKNYAEVQAADDAIKQLLAAETILFECAALKLPELEELYFNSNAIKDIAELSMPALLATMLITQSLHADARLPLLDPQDISSFTARIAELDGPDSNGLEIFTDEALAWLESDLVKGLIDHNTLRSLVHYCLLPLREMFDTSTEPDSMRYSAAVLVKRG